LGRKQEAKGEDAEGRGGRDCEAETKAQTENYEIDPQVNGNPNALAENKRRRDRNGAEMHSKSIQILYKAEVL
jgi:hypothetical protein